MKSYSLLILALIAAPAFAQTETDSAMDEELDKRAGTVFYNDDTMKTMRADADIRVNWDALSPEDQSVLKERCNVILEAAAKMEPSSGDGSNGEAAAEDDAATEEPSDQSGTTEAADLGFMGNDTAMKPACAIIATY